jgi:transposase
MSIKRTRHGKQFKAEVALEALKETATLNQLASKYGLHSTQISQWRQLLIKGASVVFETAKERQNRDTPSESELYEEIGRLKVQIEFLKKKSVLRGA